MDSYTKPDLAFMRSHPAHVISLGFGSGLSPIAPGTVGSVFALPLGWLLLQLPLLMALLLVAVALVAGAALTKITADALGVHDHGAIVWDEFVGMWLAMLFMPSTALGLAMAFALFRMFDIFKPWPINKLDASIPGGWGIMLDDVLAGLLAGLVGWLICGFILPMI